MCLYQARDVNVNCGHAECQIVNTIRKLNKNIYKQDKKVNELHR